MSTDILLKDTDIKFSHFTVLKASAGSGKTYTLTKRFVQFILSDKIPRNNLRNILAITFTNISAKEMKERILSWLKAVYFNKSEEVTELSHILSLDRGTMIEKAEYLIEEILSNYSDFQVKTIDSFMTTVFKASALDFGYNPDFEILVNKDYVMKYAFDLFLRDVREGTEKARLFEEIISIIIHNKKGDASYLWDPSMSLLEEIKKIYEQLSSIGKHSNINTFSDEINLLKKKIQVLTEKIEALIKKSRIEIRHNSSYMTILPIVREGKFVDLIGISMINPPVIKPKINQQTLQKPYEKIIQMWTELGQLISQFTFYHAYSYYAPYIQIYEEFKQVIEALKKRQGKIFIEDINWCLSGYLDAEIVPDVYFRIGETIFHFLIDEFQDTSPIQWKNLFPLIENSLSQNGSAFVVGDTKQAIYGFRNADYTIMKALEKQNPFPSAIHGVHELDTNYRSLKKKLDFNEKTFKEIVAISKKYREAGSRSGLTDYVQKVKEKTNSQGYAEITIFERNNEEPPEQKKIQNLISELNRRGYQNRDIAILTQRNEDAIRVTTWLNESNILFVSYSSLDIRRRKLTGEIVALLNFLHSPTDNLSFAIFILGELFNKSLTQSSLGIYKEQLHEFFLTSNSIQPLYKSFQENFKNLWEVYFSTLFRLSGYLPLYDLVAKIFNVYKVFEVFPDEEATLVKILEVVKDFEDAGYNNIRDFLNFATTEESSEAQWNMDIPKDLDAIKVMTIHKAKGLGFPVVIILLYGEKQRGFRYIIQEDQNKASLLRVTKDTLKSNPSFKRLYTEEAIKEKVNKLNTLYVGFTRAQKELYVIGIKGKNEGYPFDILSEVDYPPSKKPERVSIPSTKQINTIPLSHSHKHLTFRSRSEEIIYADERQRGEFIHRVLFSVDYINESLDENLTEIINRVKNEMNVAYPEKEMRDILKEFIQQKEIVEFFQKRHGRRVMREQGFSDSKGNLFRLDRVILDPEKVTIIDFKTGSDKEADKKYWLQMKKYMKILSDVFPGKPVKGIIAFIDIKKLRSVD